MSVISSLATKHTYADNTELVLVEITNSHQGMQNIITFHQALLSRTLLFDSEVMQGLKRIAFQKAQVRLPEAAHNSFSRKAGLN